MPLGAGSHSGRPRLVGCFASEQKRDKVGDLGQFLVLVFCWHEMKFLAASVRLPESVDTPHQRLRLGQGADFFDHPVERRQGTSWVWGPHRRYTLAAPMESLVGVDRGRPPFPRQAASAIMPIPASRRKGRHMGPQQDQIRVVTPADRTAGPKTPGMDRQQAVTNDRIWAGFVRTDPGMVSGWHHHGEYETVIYVLTGSLRMEFGPGGANVVEARPGDFVSVAKGVVHRESNPSAEPADIIVARAGHGESIYNLAGPE